jgi:CRP-like cAMP-binding protein
MSPSAILIRKFDSIATLSLSHRDALSRLSGMEKHLDAGEAVVSEGDRPSYVTLLARGMLCRHKTLIDGRRQILSFHTSGDLPDLQSLHIDTMDHTLSAVVASTIVLFPHAIMHAFFERHPDIAGLCWRDTLIDAAIFREWMVGMGRRSASARMAHLFCEIIVKANATGLSIGDACDLPLTQTELADALGLSTVHVNRTLQELRAAGLVELRNRTLRVIDWPGLQKAGEFDPAYLHLRAPAPAMAAAASSIVMGP